MPVKSTASITSQDVCLLFQGSKPHPAHVTFGNAVDADFIHFETGENRESASGNINSEFKRLKTGLKLSQDYEIVIAEGSAPLQTLLAYGTINRETTLIFLAADETFYNLDNRPTRHLWRALGPLASRLLDGVIVISDDVQTSVHRYIPNVPSQKVHPPVANAKHETLSNLVPSSSTKGGVELLSVGTVKPANNYQMLCEAVSMLREEWNRELSLTILGSGHQKEPYSDLAAVETPGYVEVGEFAEFFDSATLYVQPSSGDAFSVAAAEGMLSGTPTVVTTGVGARELVRKDFVADLTMDSLATTIQSVMQIPETERIEIGKKQRKKVIDLTENNQATKFKEAVSSFHNG